MKWLATIDDLASHAQATVSYCAPLPVGDWHPRVFRGLERFVAELVRVGWLRRLVQTRGRLLSHWADRAVSYRDTRRNGPTLLRSRDLLEPVEGATFAPDLEARPKESQHGNAKPNALIVHEDPPGQSSLLRALVRPPKITIRFVVDPDITKIVELAGEN